MIVDSRSDCSLAIEPFGRIADERYGDYYGSFGGGRTDAQVRSQLRLEERFPPAVSAM